jgi:anti-anti-sigma regulatory factor
MCRHGTDLTLRLEGRVTMHQRLPLRRVAEQGLASGARRLRIDLRRCVALDSTTLGTLVHLCRTAGLVLLSPSADCQQLFRQMGLEELFPVETADELPAEVWTDVPAERGPATVFQRDVLQAHEALAALPGPAGETFRGVVKCLRGDDAAPKP